MEAAVERFTLHWGRLFMCCCWMEMKEPGQVWVKIYTALTRASGRHLLIMYGYKGGETQILYTEQQTHARWTTWGFTGPSYLSDNNNQRTCLEAKLLLLPRNNLWRSCKSPVNKWNIDLPPAHARAHTHTDKDSGLVRYLYSTAAPAGNCRWKKQQTGGHWLLGLRGHACEKLI